MKKIIFLDIDGVLATNKQYIMNRTKFQSKNDVAKKLGIPYPFDPKCVKIFNEILDATGADIILSSDWKYHWNLEDLDKIFQFNGVNKSPIDITIKEGVSMNYLEKNRAYQIGKYIQDNNITNYVVIDDLNLAGFMKITNDDDNTLTNFFTLSLRPSITSPRSAACVNLV